VKRVLLAATLLLAAPAATAADKVVVVEVHAASPFAWPSGQRAVVAELMAGDVELVLRPSRSADEEQLELEVRRAAQEPGTTGAVGVGRSGTVGFALVASSAAAAPMRIEDDVRQGPVAEGAIALRVSEILEVRRFDLPPLAPAPAPAPAAPTAVRPPVAPPPEPERPLFWPFIAAGGMAAQGAAGIVPAVGLGLRVPLGSWLALEPSGSFSLGRLRVNSTAGDVSLLARQATLEVLIGPTDDRSLSAGLGAGGGFASFSSSARAKAGYVGVEQSTQTAMLAVRGFGAWQTGRLRLVAFVEVSTLVPAVSVRASDHEVARVGQPWVMSGVAVGYGVTP
jgi:hypothetical protein